MTDSGTSLPDVEPFRFPNASCAQVVVSTPRLSNAWIDERNADQTTYAKMICGSCTYQRECLEYGLRHVLRGVWGGTTTLERKKIRRSLNLSEKFSKKLVP